MQQITGQLSRWALRKRMERWLSIMLTHRCNLNCKYCLYGKENETMPLEKAKSILKEAKELKFNSVSFSGGEPSLHPNFIEICDYANELGLKLELITNGINLKHSDIIHLNKLKNVRWAISIDSYDEKQNDELRGRGAFQGALKLWSHVGNQQATFITLVTKDNLLQLQKTIHFILDELGGDNVTCYRAVPLGNAIDKNLLSNEEDIYLYTTTVAKLDNHYREQGKRIYFGCGSSKEETCPMIDSWVMIMPNGEFTPCCYLYNVPYSKYEKYGGLKDFLGKDYRTQANSKIDKATIEKRKATINRFGLTFCYECIRALRDKKIIE